MATLNETVALNITGNAAQSLKAINTQVGALNKSFENLRTRLERIALGAFIANTLRWADGISDLSKSTGIAIQNIVGFTQAVQANGGSVEGAQNALNKLVLSIGEAADGGKNAQDAFREVGVSLDDLRNLSEQEILGKVISGLARIKDNATRARVEQELFSKALRGTDLRGVSSDYAAAVAAAKPYADSIETAAKAQDSLERNLNNLRIALLDLLKPINSIIAGINLSIQAFKNLALAIASAYASYKIFKLIADRSVWKALVETLKGIPAAIKSISGAMTSGNWKDGVEDIDKLTKGWKRNKEGAESAATKWQLISASVAVFFKSIGRLLGPFVAIISAFQALKFLNEATFNIKWIKDFTDYVDRLLTKIPLIGSLFEEAQTKSGRNTRGVQDRIDRDKERDALREVVEARAKDIEKIKAQGQATKEQFNELVRNVQLEKEYIKVGEQRAEIMRAVEQVTQLAANARKQLEEQIAGLDPKKDEDMIKVLRERIAQVNALEAATKKQIGNETEDLQKLRAMEQTTLTQNRIELEKYQDQLTNDEVLQALRDEASLIGLTGKELRIKTEMIRIEQAETRAVNTEKAKQRDLEIQINDARKKGNTIEAERLQLELDASKARIDAIRQATAAQKEQTQKNIDAETNYQESVFDRLKKRIKDTQEELAKYNIGDSIFDNLMSAIDQFIETGKFKFKDFAAAILREWLAMKAKMAIMDVLDAGLGKIKEIFGAMSGGGGGGSFFGNVLKKLLGSFLGFAEGGNPPVGKASIVGEKGPELFVPRTAGTIVPNDMMRGKNVNAPITNNYITNNINAVDAKSVAQLFAENRKSLLGSVRLAEKELPYRV